MDEPVLFGEFMASRSESGGAHILSVLLRVYHKAWTSHNERVVLYNCRHKAVTLHSLPFLSLSGIWTFEAAKAVEDNACEAEDVIERAAKTGVVDGGNIGVGARSKKSPFKTPLPENTSPTQFCPGASANGGASPVHVHNRPLLTQLPSLDQPSLLPSSSADAANPYHEDLLAYIDNLDATAVDLGSPCLAQPSATVSVDPPASSLVSQLPSASHSSTHLLGNAAPQSPLSPFSAALAEVFMPVVPADGQAPASSVQPDQIMQIDQGAYEFEFEDEFF